VKKIMKRILMALLMVVAVVIVAIPAKASAEEKAKVSLYVQVPADWEGPCVWAWDEAGNNAFSAWPGGEMEADSANEGWYYVWVPDWANHVIVNANAGSVQTSELILEGTNAWITITDAENVAVSYEKQTVGETPAYVEKFVIHAQTDVSWENPCLWAWSAPDGTNAFESWPGKAMTAAEDGWYTVKAPIWVNSIIVNANEGSVQTEDIAIDPAELWLTIAADGTYDFSYVDPSQAGIPDITLHVVAPSDWDMPCLWAWSAPDGTNVYSSWPGENFEEDGTGWLTKVIPGWVNSVIVNGNTGSVQTTDISIETGKDVWVIVTGPEVYEVSYSEPDISSIVTEEAANETNGTDTAESTATENTATDTTVADAADTSSTASDTTESTSSDTTAAGTDSAVGVADTTADAAQSPVLLIVIISVAAGLLILTGIIIAVKKRQAK